MTAVTEIRQQLGHPVVDGDGHILEFLPVIEDLVRDLAGDRAADWLRSTRMDPPVDRDDAPVEQRRASGAYTVGRWLFPASNTLDRATAMLPGLAHERLEEIGIDYALVYPTFGLSVFSLPDAEIRQALARACNTYYAQVFDGFRDRLEPVATIPTFTPEEAIAELDHAVGTLGLKAITMGAVVPRQTTLGDGTKVRWLDHLGHESLYDYDPLWQRCVELGVTPTFHAKGAGWGSRCSTTNYVYNHLGDFASAQEAACRSLLMAGVPRRFPELRFAFLEGGVAWGCQLYADVVSHFEKRNAEAVRLFEPSTLDVDEFRRLVERYATGRLVAEAARVDDALSVSTAHPRDDRVPDDFAESQLRDVDDIREVFTRQFYFGCEADDPLTALAFARDLNPGGARLNPVFASDVGHWDVPDMLGVLPEAFELVEDGHLDAEAFSRFTCWNVVEMLTANNPGFFDGTAVADAARSRALADAPG